MPIAYLNEQELLHFVLLKHHHVCAQPSPVLTMEKQVVVNPYCGILVRNLNKELILIFATICINLKTILLRKEATLKKNTLHDSIYVKFKDR